MLFRSISKTLLDAETRYLPLEKLLLALVTSSRKLRHYFLAHRIEVPTVHPLASVLRKEDLSGRVAAWSVELGEYDLHFVPRTAVKGQVLADFVAEFSSNTESTSSGDSENQKFFSWNYSPHGDSLWMALLATRGQEQGLSLSRQMGLCWSSP